MVSHSSLTLLSSSGQLGVSDYQLITKELIFEVGDSEQAVEIQILGDATVEETEVFSVEIFVLEQPVTAEITIKEVEVTIEDGDGQ